MGIENMPVDHGIGFQPEDRNETDFLSFKPENKEVSDWDELKEVLADLHFLDPESSDLKGESDLPIDHEELVSFAESVLANKSLLDSLPEERKVSKIVPNKTEDEFSDTYSMTNVTKSISISKLEYLVEKLKQEKE